MSKIVSFKRGDLIIDNTWEKTGLIIEVRNNHIKIKWFGQSPLDKIGKIAGKPLATDAKITKVAARRWIMNGQWTHKSIQKG